MSHVIKYVPLIRRHGTGDGVEWTVRQTDGETYLVNWSGRFYRHSLTTSKSGWRVTIYIYIDCLLACLPAPPAPQSPSSGAHLHSEVYDAGTVAIAAAAHVTSNRLCALLLLPLTGAPVMLNGGDQ